MIIIMDNISYELAHSLKTAFEHTQYVNNVSLPNSFWNIMYVGRPNADYCFKPFIGLCKMLKIDQQPLFNEIVNNINIPNVTLENGNINFTLTNNYIQQKLNLILNTDLINHVDNQKTILVDFSSPNVAKDMHVGHLRSTIIGDIIARYFELQGHIVHRINHIGDFGLPFGMIIQYMIEEYADFENMRNNLTINNLQEFYAKSKERFDSDPIFNQMAHQRVVELQNGDPMINNAWNIIKDISRDAYNQIYDRLNVNLEEVGESFYQNMIPDLVNELNEKNLLIQDNGRLIIKINGHDVPLTVVKTDGSYTYDTTDLAAIRYRLVNLNVDKIYYVVGTAQTEHFDLIFKAAKLAGWVRDDQELHHIGFGLILGPDGKPFKSRNGDTVKLIDLLDKGIEKSADVIKNKSDKLTSDEIDTISRSVAYSAIKYYDLSSSRLKDYKFSYDAILSLTGNSSVYNLYAYTRIMNILKKLPEDVNMNNILNIDNFVINHISERELSLQLIQFAEVFDRVGNEFYIHYLCDYLYKLSISFHNFYTNCRCIEYAEDKKTIVEINNFRILLCYLTQKVMSKCFELLNITTLTKM